MPYMPPYNTFSEEIHGSTNWEVYATCILKGIQLEMVSDADVTVDVVRTVTSVLLFLASDGDVRNYVALLDTVNDIHPTDDVPEDGVFTIEDCAVSADKEFGGV